MERKGLLRHSGQPRPPRWLPGPQALRLRCRGGGLASRGWTFGSKREEDEPVNVSYAGY